MPIGVYERTEKHLAILAKTRQRPGSGFAKGYTPHNKGVKGYTLPKGREPWNKGIPMSETAKKKLSRAKRGIPSKMKSRICGPLSDEHRQKLSEAGKRKIFTVEHRANLSKALKGRKITWDTNSSNPSNLSWKLAEFLVHAGFEIVVPEASFPPYTVDVLLAEEWIGFEADGTYWHDQYEVRAPGYHNKRDQTLLEKYELPIVRISEDEINNFSRREP